MFDSRSPYPLIDIGANLTDKSFTTDFDEVILRAKRANVTQFVVTGSDLAKSRSAYEMSLASPEMFSSTAGIHPHHASSFSDEVAAELRSLLENPEVVAVGETGLDYFRDVSPRSEQRESFVSHLELAAECGKPLFLHQRDAHRDFLEILQAHRDDIGDVVVHCFTDTAEAMHDYLNLDCHIGITGWICDERRGTHLLNCVADIPLDRLMIETDAPYLMPRTIKPRPKTRRNEPCTLPYVLQTVAEARPESEEEIALATTATARAFFGMVSNPE